MRWHLIKSLMTLIAIVLTTLTASAQDTRLANQYFSSGEYEKAATTYLKLYNKNPRQSYLFDNYIKCLIELEDYDLAEKALKKEIKDKPKKTNNYVTYGNLLEKQERMDEATKWYRKGIDELPVDVGVINSVGATFSRIGKYELALEAYKKGEQLLGEDKFPFENSIAEVYRKLDMPSEMVTYYLKYAKRTTTRTNNNSAIRNTKSNMKYWMRGDSTLLDEMQGQLYTLIQAEPEVLVFPELMEWVHIEREDYGSALRQARALDRRLEEPGDRVLSLGEIARKDGDNDTALKAYDYLINKKGVDGPHYITANSLKFRLLSDKAMDRKEVVPTELDSIDRMYTAFFDQVGINSGTDYVVKQYADFLALNKNDMDKAITVLEDLVVLSSIDKATKASSKISLADFYLMRGEVWEATLLYSQVDKDNEEGLQGEIARFKNAMLFYYEGEFAWAQEQFDILESATSKLISNDAIDMSVFIMDNMGLDTTDIPLKMFAQSQFHTVQNKYGEAYEQLESILSQYPEHSLEDDIMFQKAEIHQRKREYTKALELYTKVFTDFNEEIRADNALMRAAEIHELILLDTDKAMELYEKLYLDFSNSTFAVIARKRFRRLRGDDV